jgi:hypothetical protein
MMMRMMLKTKHYLLTMTACAAAPCAFGAAPEIRTVDALPAGNEVRIAVELTAPVTPTIQEMSNPSRLIIYFPGVALGEQERAIAIGTNGVGEVQVRPSQATAQGALVTVGMDSVRPYGVEASGNKLVLHILPHEGQEVSGAAAKNSGDLKSVPAIGAEHAGEAPATIGRERTRDEGEGGDQQQPGETLMAFSRGAPPEVEHLALRSVVEGPQAESPATARHRFRVKFISGRTAYIDGGSNSGLQTGMNLDIRDPHASIASGEDTIASVRIVGVATTSAITEVGESNGDLHVGDWADLTPADAAAAARNVLTSATESFRAPSTALEEEQNAARTGDAGASRLRSTEPIEADAGSRMAGRVGLDFSGIDSDGSTPGASTQIGLSFESHMTHILGTHWNLEGYWRGRTNRHSQFQQETIDDTLNKTYTMQLYYDNPNSRWAAGMGRLYLPWAVSLDTIDGGYLGFKPRPGMTTGIFAGSTPDLSSWHYRPDQRIGGWFTNFEGGDYDRFHYSSTAGIALSSIRWKLDRPYAFFENEASYKGKVSAYHSLIVDSPQGVSTNGIRPGTGISHSYFTFHYVPNRIVSLDFYDNYFRDVPTALTSIVGTGLVDKLLFQGISGGVRVKPMRQFTLYSTMGTSAKTGDLHRSLNQMYGATWNEIWHSGVRADFHYSKFDSNFAEGNYRMLSLSRQLTNRMYWNIQAGAQHVESEHTMDCDSVFFDESLDINLGRHSYLQSGYTYVNGETMNYRQWYMSWGYRFDQGKTNPAFVQSLQAGH